MAIKSEDSKEYIAALGNISSLLGGNLGLGSANIANLNNVGRGKGSFLGQIADIRQQQQGPQLGPDDFGSYTIPMSDPTYSSGFDYARSIAGGMPMSQVIAPGVSYSPEQPMGYTQEQLNRPKDMPAPPPPPRSIDRRGDDVDFLGTGIGGVNIPVDRKQDFPPLSNLLNIGKLFGGGFDQEAIDKIVQERIAESMPTFEQPDLSKFITKEDLPAPNIFDEEALRKELIEDMRGSINIPDISGLARLEDIPSFDPSVLKQDILMSIPQQQVPDVSKFVTQDDISKAIAGIDMPTLQQPDLSVYDTRLAQLEEQLAGFKQPTGGRFSVDQQLPMGLF